MDSQTVRETALIGATAVVCLGSLVVALRLIYGRSVLVSLMSWFAAMLVIAVVIAFALGRLGLTPWTLGVGSAIGTAAIVGLVAVMVRLVLRPMRELVRAVDQFVGGDVSIAIAYTSKDEIGTIAARLREMIAYQQLIGEVAAAVAEGDLTRRVEPRSGKDVLGTAFGDMIANLRALIGEVQTSANDLADTSQQLGAGANQASQVVQQVAHAVQNVAVGAQDTSRSSRETNAAIAQLSQAIDEIAHGATDQANQVQSVTGTAAGMAADVDQVSANATRVAAASHQAEVSAQHGADAVRETVEGMREIKAVVGEAASKVQELGKLSESIGAVVATIDDIADQTNLLALNAAIEAARAGEHGKGFAVVADEVRKLADRSSRETKQIAALIREVQNATHQTVEAMVSGAAKVEQGSAKADLAGQALGEILTAVMSTGHQVDEIGSAARQMSVASRSVVDAMQSISAVVEENTAATEEMAAQTGQVTQAIKSIAAISEEQSAATQQVSAASEEMSAQVDEMRAQAEEMSATAFQLKSLARRFRLDATAGQMAESDPVLAKFDAALVAHAQWKVRLQQAIATGTADVTPETTALDDRCAFGQFLYQGAGAELRRSEQYERVRTLHAAFHQIAAETLRLAVGHAQDQARESLASGGRFMRASAALTRALLDWQREYTAGKGKIVPLRRAA